MRTGRAPPRRSRSPPGCGARPRGRPATPGQTVCSEMSSAPSREPESGGTTVLSSSVHSATHAGPGGVSSPALSRRSRSESGSSCWQAVGAGGGAERAGERREVGAVVRRGEGDRAAYVRAAAEVGDVDADHDAAGGVADQVHRRRARSRRAPRRRRRARCGGLVAQVLGARSRSASRCGRPARRRPGRRPGPAARRSSRRTPGTSSTGPGRSWATGSTGGSRRTTTATATATASDQRQHRHAQHQPAPRGGERVEHATSVRRAPVTTS